MTAITKGMIRLSRCTAPHDLEQTEPNESISSNRRLNLLAALVASVPERRTLLARLRLAPPLGAAFVKAWSIWRRRHQATAALAHYRQRINPQL
jgi:hypothetical protein